MSRSVEIASRIARSIPENGLFSGKSWRTSPDPFFLSSKTYRHIAELGKLLKAFLSALDLLYRQSVQGKYPEWIAQLIDQGKPEELRAISNSKAFKTQLPRVIRPDLLLQEHGFRLTEIDSVPGGIGVTSFLQAAYADRTPLPLNKAMPEYFLESLLSEIKKTGPAREPGDSGKLHIAITVSDEAADYRPEMEWLTRLDVAARMGLKISVCKPEELQRSQEGVDLHGSPVHLIYRFFELFDLPNISNGRDLLNAAMEGQVALTPPPKYQQEEKMWFALFWLRPLREFWRRELGDKYDRELRQVIPFTWILDPAPLPPHAVYPGLDIQDWRELGGMSQKERDFALKISGFSELAWGSRGVHLGSDLSGAEWRKVLENALGGFESKPYILQRFEKTHLFEQSWLNPDTGTIEQMKGRVRLCPYFFLIDEDVHLGGTLATICPANKKLIHGMSDAILTIALPSDPA
jgi:hypothetical protein